MSTQTQLSGTPSLTVQPPYTGFSLQAFFFGCALPAGNAVVSVATQCTIFVSGFVPGSNQEVAVASFTFAPPTPVVGETPLIQAVLPSSFNNPNIRNMTVVQGNPVTQVLVLDDVKYCLYK